jgi:predicted phage terminase large subunit-like protein
MATQKTLRDLLAVQQLEYALARNDLGLFVQASWKVLEPNVDLKWNWHHDYICEYLQSEDIKRLIINIAPRSTKSILSTICYPVWKWTKDPSTRFLFGSYANSLATKHSVLRRNLIESQWYQDGYGDEYQLSSDVNTKTEFTNDRTGQMKAAGIKASIIGLGADCIIIDDPHNPKGAESDLDRESTIQSFDLAWSTRLNNKKTGRIIVIMQRLHENDLTGHLISKELGYTHIKIPSIAEERETLVFPISNRTLTREAGDYMHPARDGVIELNQAKKDLGPYGFSGQHQQNPTPSKGGLFTQEMFDFVEMPKAFDYLYIIADTAYTDKTTSDFHVFTAFGMLNGELYIPDVFRKQIKASEVEEPAIQFIKRFSSYGFRGAYIEPKGHGIYLNQLLPKRGILIPTPNQIKDFFSDRRLSKVERANNAVPYLANRRIHINHLIQDKEILVAEALKFPKANHDDFVDTLIDGVKLAFSSRGVGGFTQNMVDLEKIEVGGVEW